MKKIFKIFTLLIMTTFLHGDSPWFDYENLIIHEYKLTNGDTVYLYKYHYNMFRNTKHLYVLKHSNEDKEKNIYLDNNETEIFYYDSKEEVTGVVKVLYVGFDNPSIKVNFKDDVLKIDAVEINVNVANQDGLYNLFIKGILQQFVWKILDAQTCNLIEKKSKELMIKCP